MSSNSFKPQVFVSYSHRDIDLKLEFDTNLRVMQRQGIIEKWTDGEIQPGDHWADEITSAMEKSQVILFLVSNNFLDSDFIRNVEAPMAMRMRDQGRAVIVPVLLRLTPGWRNEDWYCLLAMPSELKPIEHESWRDVRVAFAEVEKGLRALIEVLPDKLAKQAARWAAEAGPRAAASAVAAGDVAGSVAADSMSRPSRRRRPLFWGLSTLGVVGIAVAGALLFQSVSGGRKSSDSRAPGMVFGNHPASEPFENSLGMRFVSLPGTKVLCSIWELRVGDFKAFVDAGAYEVIQRMETWEPNPETGKFEWGAYGKTWRNPGFDQSLDHPVVGISLIDAKRFCEWLTRKERAENSLPEGYEYRLIRDNEWSLAAGEGIYPWNPWETPPSRRGNYQSLHLAPDGQDPGGDPDGFENTAPVGSFDANPLGIFDLGGNVLEVCDTPYTKDLNSAHLLNKFPIGNSPLGSMCARGGSWSQGDVDLALTEIRWPSWDKGALSNQGFRLVLSPIGEFTTDQAGWTSVSSFGFESDMPFGTAIETSASGSRVTLSGESGATLSVPILGGREFKDFEAEVRYRVMEVMPRDALFGIAFEFRGGANAPNGYRVFVHGEAGTWGHGYWRDSFTWQSHPFRKIEAGRMNLDGSLNSLRVSVRGDACKIYSNDCLIGAEKLDVAPLAGGLKLMAELTESLAADPGRTTTIGFESVRVRELD